MVLKYPESGDQVKFAQTLYAESVLLRCTYLSRITISVEDRVRKFSLNRYSLKLSYILLLGGGGGVVGASRTEVGNCEAAIARFGQNQYASL